MYGLTNLPLSLFFYPFVLLLQSLDMFGRQPRYKSATTLFLTYSNKISVARKASVQLQIELSEKRNLSRILDKGSSAYLEVGDVKYIARPNTSPFELFNE